MTPVRRAQNAAKTQDLLAALPQQALQQARAHAHAELAQCLQGTPRAINQLEHQMDLSISTFRRCIEALGGTLDIAAHVPDGSIPITHFAEGDAD